MPGEGHGHGTQEESDAAERAYRESQHIAEGVFLVSGDPDNWFLGTKLNMVPFCRVKVFHNEGTYTVQAVSVEAANFFDMGLTTDVAERTKIVVKEEDWATFREVLAAAFGPTRMPWTPASH